MPDWLGLAGQRALIAGGGGTIGRALVDGFATAGATVAVVDVTDDAMAGLEDRTAARHAADLSDAAAARAAVAAVRDELGGLDVFVHCVGINDRRPIEDYSASDVGQDHRRQPDERVPHRDRGGGRHARARNGRILFFSSVAGRSGHKHHGPYAATKGAINQLMRVIAHEYAEHGVTANAVAPGYMDTTLTRSYLAANPDKREALIELIPAQRFGTLAEVVDPVLFLCSPHASFITGQVLYIDGGRTIV